MMVTTMFVNMQMGPKTGDARNFTDFEQVYAAWKTQLQWLMNILGRVKDPEFFGRPMLSALSERSVESGLDAVSPVGDRGNAWITAFTWVENIDSLVAIKKFIFEDKKYSMSQLMDALEAEWNGYEEVRLDFDKQLGRKRPSCLSIFATCIIPGLTHPLACGSVLVVTGGCRWTSPVKLSWVN